MVSEEAGIGTPEELDSYLQRHPELATVEVVSVDMNGMLRGKRMPRSELRTFFDAGVHAPGSVPLLNSLGDACDDVGVGTLDGDPDKHLRPVAGSLAPIPWLASATHQVLATWFELDDSPLLWDPRAVLRNAMQPLTDLGLRVVIATELEFYLLAEASGPTPQPRLAPIPGTTLGQDGIQYGAQDDLWEFDEFLDAVRRACEVQNLPATTAHTEWAPGQFEINLHHVDDVVLACDHAVLLKRLIKGTAKQQHLGATFMAKPFAAHSGSGLHIHISVYDAQGENIFVDAASSAGPPISARMRHAIGGLAATMAEAQCIFAPNANSYRRLQPGCFAPLSPNWGYNNRNLSLRIPVSDAANLRIEHRVAGADANPYLVVASVLAGIHHGLTRQCEPGPEVPEGAFMEKEDITLPTEWGAALQVFENAEILPAYLGADYARLFAAVRRDEYRQFQASISNLDYEWYLRAV
jgi:glutamine synthetase